MNFSIVCMAFLLLVGFVQMESTNCPTELKKELDEVTDTCFPGAKEKFHSGLTPSPEEKLQGLQCIVGQIPHKPNIQNVVSSCAAPTGSTEAELETYMTCVKPLMDSTGCFPKSHENTHN